jgi:hypothetical protein
MTNEDKTIANNLINEFDMNFFNDNNSEMDISDVLDSTSEYKIDQAINIINTKLRHPQTRCQVLLYLLGKLDKTNMNGTMKMKLRDKVMENFSANMTTLIAPKTSKLYEEILRETATDYNMYIPLDSNHIRLYHQTRSDNMVSIMRDGLLRSHKGQATTANVNGIWFTPEATYSNSVFVDFPKDEIIEDPTFTGSMEAEKRHILFHANGSEYIYYNDIPPENIHIQHIYDQSLKELMKNGLIISYQEAIDLADQNGGVGITYIMKSIDDYYHGISRLINENAEQDLNSTKYDSVRDYVNKLNIPFKFKKWILDISLQKPQPKLFLFSLFQNGTIQKIVDYIPIFEKALKLNKIQKRNLYEYSMEDFLNTVSVFKNEDLLSNNEKTKNSVNKVYEDNNWLIIRPLEYEGCVVYGRQTTWCISGKNKDWFDRHIKNESLWIGISKTSDLKVIIEIQNGYNLSVVDNTQKHIDVDDTLVEPITHLIPDGITCIMRYINDKEVLINNKGIVKIPPVEVENGKLANIDTLHKDINGGFYGRDDYGDDRWKINLNNNDNEAVLTPYNQDQKDYDYDYEMENRIRTAPLIEEVVIKDLIEMGYIKKNMNEEKSDEKNIKKVYEDDQWLIIRPLDHKTAVIYGKDTKWSFAKEEKRYFENFFQNKHVWIGVSKTSNSKVIIDLQKDGNIQVIDKKEHSISVDESLLNAIIHLIPDQKNYIVKYNDSNKLVNNKGIIKISPIKTDDGTTATLNSFAKTKKDKFIGWDDYDHDKWSIDIDNSNTATATLMEMSEDKKISCEKLIEETVIKDLIEMGYITKEAIEEVAVNKILNSLTESQKAMILGEFRGIGNYEFRNIVDRMYATIAQCFKDNVYNNQQCIVTNPGRVNADTVYQFYYSFNEEHKNNLPWVENLQINCTVYDYNEKRETDNIALSGSYYKNHPYTQYQPETDQFKYVLIDIEMIAVQDKIDYFSYNSPLYHELNHAYEDYERAKMDYLKEKTSHNRLQDQTTREGYNSIVKDLAFSGDPNLIGYGKILAILFCQSEFNAYVTQVYGQLKGMNSQNMELDFPQTTLMKFIDECNNSIIPKLKSLPLEWWKEYIDYYLKLLFKNNPSGKPKLENMRPNGLEKYKNKFFNQCSNYLEKFENKGRRAADVWYTENEKTNLGESFNFYDYENYQIKPEWMLSPLTPKDSIFREGIITTTSPNSFYKLIEDAIRNELLESDFQLDNKKSISLYKPNFSQLTQEQYQILINESDKVIKDDEKNYTTLINIFQKSKGVEKSFLLICYQFLISKELNDLIVSVYEDMKQMNGETIHDFEKTQLSKIIFLSVHQWLKSINSANINTWNGCSEEELRNGSEHGLFYYYYTLVHPGFNKFIHNPEGFKKYFIDLFCKKLEYAQKKGKRVAMVWIHEKQTQLNTNESYDFRSALPYLFDEEQCVSNMFELEDNLFESFITTIIEQKPVHPELLLNENNDKEEFTPPILFKDGEEQKKDYDEHLKSFEEMAKETIMETLIEMGYFKEEEELMELSKIAVNELNEEERNMVMEFINTHRDRINYISMGGQLKIAEDNAKLNEGLNTTYDIDKSIAYLNNRMGDAIIEPAHKKDTLNGFSINIEIYSGENNKNIKLCDQIMTLCGYSREKSWEGEEPEVSPPDFKITNIPKVDLMYTSIFNEKKNKKVWGTNLYHVTQLKNLDRIKKYGLTPKTDEENRDLKYPDRIYFTTNRDKAMDLLKKTPLAKSKVPNPEKNTKSLDYRKYAVLKVYIAGGFTFYDDPHCKDAVYTMENIPFDLITVDSIIESRKKINGNHLNEEESIYDKVLSNSSLKFKVLNKLGSEGYVFHASPQPIQFFDSSKIKDSIFRQTYGWGAYFTTQEYKTNEYGSNLLFVNIKDFKLLKLSHKVNDDSIFEETHKEYYESRINQLDHELYSARNNREYNEITSEIESFKEKLNHVNTEEERIVKEARKVLKKYPDSDYENLNKCILGNSIPPIQGRSLSYFYMEHGYDGFINQSGSELVLFNFDKLNSNIVGQNELETLFKRVLNINENNVNIVWKSKGVVECYKLRNEYYQTMGYLDCYTTNKYLECDNKKYFIEVKKPYEINGKTTQLLVKLLKKEPQYKDLYKLEEDARCAKIGSQLFNEEIVLNWLKTNEYDALSEHMNGGKRIYLLNNNKILREETLYEYNGDLIFEEVKEHGFIVDPELHNYKNRMFRGRFPTLEFVEKQKIIINEWIQTNCVPLQVIEKKLNEFNFVHHVSIQSFATSNTKTITFFAYPQYHDQINEFLKPYAYQASMEDAYFDENFEEVEEKDVIKDKTYYRIFDLTHRMDKLSNYDLSGTTIYHATDAKNFEKIMKNGLEPRTTTNFDNHPNRVYFAINKIDLKEILFKNKKFYNASKRMCVFAIPVNDTFHYKLFSDPKMGEAVYSVENIDPKFLFLDSVWDVKTKEYIDKDNFVRNYDKNKRYYAGVDDTLNEGNSRLKSHKFIIPKEIMQNLKGRFEQVEDNEQYGDLRGYKRLHNIIMSNGELNYLWMNRLHHFWLNYKGDPDKDLTGWLNGGKLMRDWVDKALKDAEKAVKSSKKASKKAGLNNSFISTHYKDTSGIQTNPKAITFGGTGVNKKNTVTSTLK